MKNDIKNEFEKLGAIPTEPKDPFDHNEPGTPVAVKGTGTNQHLDSEFASDNEIEHFNCNEGDCEFAEDCDCDETCDCGCNEGNDCCCGEDDCEFGQEHSECGCHENHCECGCECGCHEQDFEAGSEFEGIQQGPLGEGENQSFSYDDCECGQDCECGCGCEHTESDVECGQDCECGCGCEHFESDFECGQDCECGCEHSENDLECGQDCECCYQNGTVDENSSYEFPNKGLNHNLENSRSEIEKKK